MEGRCGEGMDAESWDEPAVLNTAPEDFFVQED